jgi:hypothetical protein
MFMKKPYRYGLWTLGGIWAIAMVALSPQFVAAHRETNNALQAFDGYSSSLVNQQFEEAYRQCGTDFHDAMPYDQFVNLQKSLQLQFGPLKSVRRSTYEVHGSGTPMHWRAVIDAEFIYQNKNLPFRLLFHKEGERWTLFGSEQL